MKTILNLRYDQPVDREWMRVESTLDRHNWASWRQSRWTLGTNPFSAKQFASVRACQSMLFACPIRWSEKKTVIHAIRYNLTYWTRARNIYADPTLSLFSRWKKISSLLLHSMSQNIFAHFYISFHIPAIFNEKLKKVMNYNYIEIMVKIWRPLFQIQRAVPQLLSKAS